MKILQFTLHSIGNDFLPGNDSPRENKKALSSFTQKKLFMIKWTYCKAF